MATGSTNAAGRAEALRTADTSQIAASAALIALLSLKSGDSLDMALEILHEETKHVVQLDEDVKVLYGLEESADMNTVFWAIKETVVPEAVKVSEDVLLMYNLAEADINKLFRVILQETIPNAIQEAVGDAMGGEY